MRTVIFASILAAAVAGATSAADAQTTAQTTTAQPEPSKPSCFDSVLNFVQSSVRDCPLSVGPFTFYGNIDMGYGYTMWGAPVGSSADKPNYGISRNSRNLHWLWSANGASTSVVGITLDQKLQGEWSLVGVVEGGFNPYTLRFINGPRSLADNNFRTVPNQTTEFNSSRAGQVDNSQGYIGVSNPVFGTLTFGRTNSLSQSAIGAYDPVQSVAFSQIGFSGSYAGFGVTTTTRVNTALTYRLTYQGFRFAGQMQVGGYDLGNAATNQYQLLVGTDIGKLSLDAIGGYARNAATFSSFAGAPIPADLDPNSVLRATLQNAGGFALLARYNWNPFKFYLGYIYSRTSNPSNDSPGGFPTPASGISVPPGFVTANNFAIPRNINTVWTGVRYAVRPNVDLSTGFYYEQQNDFLPAPGICAPSGRNNSRCAGDRWSYSVMVEYRPVSRLSLYAGMMYSTVSGGVSNGFLHTSNVDPTVGIRVRF